MVLLRTHVPLVAASMHTYTVMVLLRTHVPLVAASMHTYHGGGAAVHPRAPGCCIHAHVPRWWCHCTPTCPWLLHPCTHTTVVVPLRTHVPWLLHPCTRTTVVVPLRTHVPLVAASMHMYNSGGAAAHPRAPGW
jgi:hypothetical protein